MSNSSKNPKCEDVLKNMTTLLSYYIHSTKNAHQNYELINMEV